MRYEDFSDFGSTFDWKLTGMYEASDNLKFRGSVSTGFRAPTIGQSSVRCVQTQYVDGELIDIATLPPTNAVSARFGGVALKPEESTSFTLGAIYQTGDFFLTVDYFNIEVTDRISQTSPITLTDADRAEFTGLGVTDAIGLTSVKFFTNDFDTTTEGLDLVASYSNEMLSGDMSYALAYNYTKTTVDFAGNNVNETKIGRLENGLPKSRGSFTTTYSADKLRVMGIINHYGTWQQYSPDVDGPTAWLLDTEVSYDINESFGVAVGINNLTDENGPVVPGVPGAESGRTYSSTTPYGFNGRFYYAKLSYHY
jgi:iron complex outermembrane receptor protein